MSKLILVTGGARSGKSTYAETRAKEFGNDILYVATSKAIDEEMVERIRKHRAQRPAHWETLEAYRDLDNLISEKLENKDAVLLDCMTIMITNLMLDECWDWDNIKVEQVGRIEENIRSEFEKLIGIANSAAIPFILVTNEVGLGVVPPYKIGIDFRDIAGRINQMVAKAADEVYFCVSGIPMKIK